MKNRNNSFQEIWSKLKTCKKAVMTLHAGPDGDSLGSCSAMKYFLERDLGMEVILVSHDHLEANLAKLPFAKEIVFGKDILDLNLKDFDVFLALDCASPSMLGKSKKDFKIPNDLFVINFDHHATNDYYGSLNYVDGQAPSACTVLKDFFQSINAKFDHELCIRLLVGLCTDTGFFSYDNSVLRALGDAVFLIEHGKIDYYNEVLLPIRMSIPLATKKLHSLVISNLVVDSTLHCAYSVIRESDVKRLGLNYSEIRGGIYAIQDIEGVDFTFTLTEMPDLIKGSFRSARNVDVSRFAVALGGGGHKPAAAFVLPKMPLTDAVKKVLEAIKKTGTHPIKP